MLYKYNHTYFMVHHIVRTEHTTTKKREREREKTKISNLLLYLWMSSVCSILRQQHIHKYPSKQTKQKSAVLGSSHRIEEARLHYFVRKRILENISYNYGKNQKTQKKRKKTFTIVCREQSEDIEQKPNQTQNFFTLKNP